VFAAESLGDAEDMSAEPNELPLCQRLFFFGRRVGNGNPETVGMAETVIDFLKVWDVERSALVGRVKAKYEFEEGGR
jgi:hypothetical protein